MTSIWTPTNQGLPPEFTTVHFRTKKHGEIRGIRDGRLFKVGIPDSSSPVVTEWRLLDDYDALHIHQDVKAIPAGPRLNEQVAEHVMGWERPQPGQMWWREPGVNRLTVPSRFSEDERRAMEVVHHLIAKGYDFSSGSVRADGQEQVKFLIHFTFSREGEPVESSKATRPSHAEAICRCALKAVRLSALLARQRGDGALLASNPAS